ncbi:MAG: YlxR family protein [Dehalococcoidales bacterium]|nr:YlxR family protein [Dehalococcoidales bacterium]
MRTCTGCREIKPKRDMIRLVRTSGGLIKVDSGSKEAGRGAYLCPNLDCWQNGLTTSRLEHTLRATITPENRKQLMEQSKTIVGG